VCAAVCASQITALQIAALKKIGRGSKVLLLDRFGNSSKAVAKELSRRGFGRVFVVAGACCSAGMRANVRIAAACRLRLHCLS
jgi:rhodanese-related sulfurtransferase